MKIIILLTLVVCIALSNAQFVTEDNSYKGLNSHEKFMGNLDEISDYLTTITSQLTNNDDS